MNSTISAGDAALLTIPQSHDCRELDAATNRFFEHREIAQLPDGPVTSIAQPAWAPRAREATTTTQHAQKKSMEARRIPGSLRF
jgi:hypothetical protein